MTQKSGWPQLKKQKNRKASGICGWHNEELKMLPEQAIAHLTNFLQAVEIWPDCPDDASQNCHISQV